MGRWVCASCHSDMVEKLDWVDLNSGEAMEDSLEEFYCRSCGAHTEVVYEDTPTEFKDLFKKEELNEDD